MGWPMCWNCSLWAGLCAGTIAYGNCSLWAGLCAGTGTNGLACVLEL